MSFENIKTLKGVTVSSKRVLVRCDFNVPLNSQGDISDDFRIVQSLPTIQYLVENKAKVILMSHLDPEGTGTVLAKFNLQKVSEKLSEYLKIPIIKANDCIGPQVESQSNALQDGEVMILENLRFHKEEVEGDTEFAKKLSYIGDIYVNDAFSVCHRNHASVSLLPGYLPSYMGFLVEKEIDNLNKILYNPVKPFVVLIGGKKVESKSTIIEKISEVADCVIISGLIKKEIIEKGIKFSHPEKIIGPSDSLDSPDITEETVRVFYKEIMKAKTVLWNGPFGKFEEERYEKGTLQLADAIIESQAFSAVGGGETVEFLKKKGMIEKFSHVSTGGGAMLQYLSKESLPGLEALKNWEFKKVIRKIKNIEKAAERIKQAVHNKECIILYGDSDMDGISSVVILEEAIKSLGGEVDSVFFPDRENDGYGINSRALSMLKDKAPALFITLDLGIGNIEEVKIANKMGFEIIIIDHHETLSGTPEALFIVDPKQKTDDYPFKEMANVGITFKLCEEILGSNMSVSLRNSFLELAALGTIADMVLQVKENKEIIEEGLRSLRNTYRPALRAFLEILGTGNVFENSLGKIISSLNAAESVNFKNESYLLLTSSSAKECKELVQKLIDKVAYKQQQIRSIVEEVKRRILRKEDQPIIFEGDPSWRLVLAGAVASIISQEYGKPAFIFKKMDKESCGSVRNPKGTNSVDAMKTCSDFLLTYGGHAQASGFRIKNENLEKFRSCLIEYFKN